MLFMPLRALQFASPAPAGTAFVYSNNPVPSLFADHSCSSLNAGDTIVNITNSGTADVPVGGLSVSSLISILSPEEGGIRSERQFQYR